MRISSRARDLIGLADLLHAARPSGPLGAAARDAVRPFGPNDAAAWAAERSACRALSDVGLADDGGLAEQLGTLESPAMAFARAAGGDADESDLFRLKRFLFVAARIGHQLEATPGYEPAPLSPATLDAGLRSLQPVGELRSRFTLSDEGDPELAAARGMSKDARAAFVAAARRRREALESRWGVSVRKGVVHLEPTTPDDQLEVMVDTDFELVARGPHGIELRVRDDAAIADLRAASERADSALDALEARRIAETGRRLAAAAPELPEHAAWLGRLDFRLAKARLARTWPAWPEPADTTSVVGGWLPSVRRRVDADGGVWQGVAIEAHPEVTLLTGPNMGGKTVTLAVLATAQVLAQCAYPVPAESATFRWVEHVDYVGGELGSFDEGLSSFAGKMAALAEALAAPGVGLVLVDELAAGTSPAEGAAVSAAAVQVLVGTAHTSVVVTHHQGAEVVAGVRRLRVRGLRGVDPEHLRADAASRGWKAALNSVMDFALVDDDGSHTGSDALRIAELLDLPPDLIAAARARLEQESE